MIPVPTTTKIWLVAGPTDMRKGFNTLAAQVEKQVGLDPYSGHLFLFCGRHGGQIKMLWWDCQGLICQYRVAAHGRMG